MINKESNTPSSIEPKTAELPSGHDLIKYLIVALVIIIISFLFPKSPDKKQSLQVGDRWESEAVIADKEVVVLKSKENVDLEKKEIRKNFIPYYASNTNIAKQARINLQTQISDFFQQIGGGPEEKLIQDGIVRKIDSLYKVGLYTPQDFESLKIRLNDKVVATKLLNTESDAEQIIQKYVESFNTSFADKIMNLVSLYVEPNIVYDENKTNAELDVAFGSISQQLDKIIAGDQLIAKGEVVDQRSYNRLTSYFKQESTSIFSNVGNFKDFLGYLLLTCLIIGILLLYLKFHFPEVYTKFSSLLFILMWPLLISLLVAMIEKNDLSSYLIPFCIVPIIVKNFYGERLALFVHIVIVLLASFLSNLGYEFTFLEILAGIVTVLYVSETRFMNKFFIAVLIIFGTYMLGYLGLSLIKTDINDIAWSNFGYLGFSALLTLMAYPFIPLVERIFGFTSSISLAELADMNRPLLKRLSIEASGTMQHSLRVSSLSEAAAEQIGANSLLIKVAALYHDIGKLQDPLYYIENQSGSNPHDQLSNFESAKMIIDHVVEGEQMAKKAKLPQILIDFITTHHGTTRTEYFYRNQLKEFPDQEFDEILFRYPGPKPTTKEHGILMMADSLEAASKSLKSPTGQDIDKLVDAIIASKIKNDQFVECDLTLKELEECTIVFKSILRSMNHVRVEYPE